MGAVIDSMAQVKTNLFILPYINIYDKGRGEDKYPYAGIIRVRYEGMISARNIGHPLAYIL